MDCKMEVLSIYRDTDTYGNGTPSNVKKSSKISNLVGTTLRVNFYILHFIFYVAENKHRGNSGIIHIQNVLISV